MQDPSPRISSDHLWLRKRSRTLLMRGTSDKTKWNWCWSKIGEYYGTPLHLKPNKISGFRDIRHASILNISNMRIRPGPAFPAAICLSSSSRSSRSLHQHRRHSSEDAIFWPALFTAVRWQAHKIFWMASPWKGWNMVMTFASVHVTWNMVKTSRSNTQLAVSSNGHIIRLQNIAMPECAL